MEREAPEVGQLTWPGPSGIPRSVSANLCDNMHPPPRPDVLSLADRVYVSLGTAGTYPGYGPAVPRET